MTKQILTYLILISSSLGFSQVFPSVVQDDSIPSFYFEDFVIKAPDAEYQRMYNRMRYHAKHVYDYAMIASAMLNEYQDSLKHIDRKIERNKYLRQADKYLKDEFGDEISKMSVTRGMVLMKIIHKETGLTAYDIIKNYRGGMKAMWWQNLVKMFGTTLKYEYEPLGQDRALAQVLGEIEIGKIKPYPRKAKTEAAKKAMSKRKKRREERKQKRRAKAARQD